MAQVEPMKPKKTKVKAKKVVINDTRFGRRQFFLNEAEKPSIKVQHFPVGGASRNG